MLRFLFHGTLILLAAVLTRPLLSQEQGGSICGVVQDETGRPAAVVRIDAVDEGPHSGPYDRAITDTSGRYCMEHVRPGEYFMSADDPEKAYPLMDVLFYASHAIGPRVVISPQSPRQRADWKIPYQAGFLHIHATDRVTGRAVRGVTFSAAVRGSEDRRWMRGSLPGDSAILVPPNEDIYITLQADGYKSWQSLQQKSRLLVVRPGASVDLDVLMDAKR